MCNLYLRPLLQGSEEGIDHLVEPAHITALQIFHLQVYTIIITITRYLGHLGGENLGILDILAGVIQFCHHHIYIVLQSLALAPGLEPDDERTVVDAGSGDDTKTGNLGITLDLLQPQHMFLYLRHDFIGLDERRTGRRRHIHEEDALVLLRNKSGRQCAHRKHHDYRRANEQ